MAERQELTQLLGEVGFKAAGDLAGSKRGEAERDRDAALASGDLTAAAEAQQCVDAWDDSGSNKVLLHELIGAAVAALGGGNITGAAAGAAGAELVKKAMLNYLAGQGLNPDSAQYNVLIELASAAIGAGLGGVSGAGSALAGDQFNRQLHPDEVKWIRQHAGEFARQEGISGEQAKQILLVDAAAYVDSRVQGKLSDSADNVAAIEFLKKNQTQYSWGTAFDTSNRDNFHMFGNELARSTAEFRDVFNALASSSGKVGDLRPLYGQELLTYGSASVGP